ncbi:tho complex subunit 3 [Stylonychia lemnae]|uniref:Tho complex subunit 3 n=1 Tax=Stylonychia lemnae TaxID=5949 RepID=A0A077ZSB6_STYLE|nr:tho complex subunit 3 [Stylonychia lemnae]|eukprot:CDW72783.1 tho complex subunit 3 [Stylonychia lemnae]
MMNLSMFLDVQPKAQSQSEIFKTYKLTDFPVNKKRICCLQWNKSGSKLAIGSYDTTIKMFSLDGYGLTKTQEYKGHSDQVESLAWHPTNESVFVTTSMDKTIRIWDAKAGKQVRSDKTKEENLSLTFNPDGNILGVSNIQEELCFYDFRMWKIIKQIKFKNEVNDFTWDKSANGQALLVADSSGAISVFNGQTLSSQPLATLNYHYTPCNSLAVDPNNNYFVSGGSDSLICLWDMQEFITFNTISNNDFKVLALNISYDGQYIASISEDDFNKKFYVEVYEGLTKNKSNEEAIDIDSQYSSSSNGFGGLNTKQTLYSYSSSSSKICLQWHPKRNILAFAGEEKNEGLVHLLHPTV